MKPTPPFKIVRAYDPETSRVAAHRVRSGTHKATLLAVYLREGWLTDEQAAEKAGIEGGWKRCSDLRNEGYIRQAVSDGVPVTVMGRHGTEVMVCHITPAGREAILA